MAGASVVGTTRGIRLHGLTGLRWWAAFLVFFYHIQVFAPIPGPLMEVFGQGYRGVTFFFVLSGFVLTWSWAASVSRSTFYWRRFARIFPAHAVAWVIALPVFYAVLPIAYPDWVKPVDVPVLGLSFVLLQGWSTDPLILFAGNPAAWTLTVEAFCYFLHPFAQKLLKRYRVNGSLVAGVLVFAVAVGYRASTLLFPGHPLANLPAPIQHAPEFLIGMTLAWALRSGWRPKLPVWVGVPTIVVALCSIPAMQRIAPESLVTKVVIGFGNEIFTFACALAIVAVAGVAIQGRRDPFADRAQVVLGEWSYTFYLVHASVMYAVMHFVPVLVPSWSNVLPATGILAVGLLLAGALHLGVERPVERVLRRWKDQRDLNRAGVNSGGGSSHQGAPAR